MGALSIFELVGSQLGGKLAWENLAQGIDLGGIVGWIEENLTKVDGTENRFVDNVDAGKIMFEGTTICGVRDLSLDSSSTFHVPGQVFKNEKNPLVYVEVNNERNS